MRRSLAVAVCSAVVLLLAAAADAASSRPPTARLTVSGSRHLTVGQHLRLTLRARPAHGRRIVRYVLRFGDKSKPVRGHRLKRRRVGHSFRRPGTYTIRLTVTDNRRRKATAVLRVEVRAVTSPAHGPSPAPPAPTPPAPTPPVTTPPAPLDVRAAGVEVAPGSAVGVTLPAPLQEVTRIDSVRVSDPDISASLTDSGVTVAARAAADPGATTVTVLGSACTSVDCGHPLTLSVPVTVRELAAPEQALSEFTSASPDRVAAAAPLPGGGSVLQDELVVTLGTPDNPGTRADADAVAADVDAVVSGGIDDLGVYELRWTTPQDLSTREAALQSEAGVSDISETELGIVTTSALPPGDWSDDGPEATWPFTLTHTQQAWDETTGSGVTVGIVDEDHVFAHHEDLDVIQSLGSKGDGYHATHVAGLACAKANGKGLVGFAWGCPIISADDGDKSDKAVLLAMYQVALAGAKVVNASLAWSVPGGCASQADKDSTTAQFASDRGEFRQLFRGPVGRDVIWTLAAGNDCSPGAASPFGLNSDLGNVITVAAVNSDGRLASFSDYGPGVEVAAPGGVGLPPNGPAAGGGIWSTVFKGCFLFFHCSDYANIQEDGRSPMVGTSMAAPEVAGIAALVRGKHPDFGASRAAGCITGTAGTGGVGSVVERGLQPALGVPPKVTYTGSLPIVNARAAVDCTELSFDGSPGTGAPPGTLGGFPMTAFGPDGRPDGDLVSEVTDPAGTVEFSPDLDHLHVPDSWATWSHGYQGDVYFSGEQTDPKIELTLPAGTHAFAFYAEPNTFASFTVEAIASDGTSSEPVDVQGESGARYFGFFGTGGQTIGSITINAADPSGFAVGEFQIAR